ncbi:MAG: hypothetical protein QOF82_3081 [Frankiales bacterium]|nr:hypothetical protein [Frankiales bacterium]
MFGKQWAAGSGHIVDRRVAHATADGVVIYEFVVDVTTPSGQVFRAKVGEPRIATDFRDPNIGMTVRVEYEAKSRQVRFDKDDPQLSWKAYQKAQESGFNDSLNAPAGSPIGGGNAAVPAGLDITALLKSQGLTDGTQVFQPTVVQMDPSSPEAAALRDALLKAIGGAPAAAPEPDA